MSFGRRYEGKKGVGLEERIARVERKSEGGGEKREVAGRIRGFQCRRDRFTRACDNSANNDKKHCGGK